MDDTKEVERPELAAWMWKRGFKPGDLAKVLSKAPVTVARYLLPFDHPLFRRPVPDDMALIKAWTSGVITPEHYYPKSLRSEHSAEAVEVSAL